MVNHEYDYRLNWTTQSSVTKICDIYGSFFKIKTEEIPIFLLAVKKGHSRACVMLHTAQLIRLDAYCPIKLSYLKAEIRAADSQADSRILLWL